MSAWEGLFLTAVTLGSCYASYYLGQRNMWERFRRMEERRRRWSEFREDFDE